MAALFLPLIIYLWAEYGMPQSKKTIKHLALLLFILLIVYYTLMRSAESEERRINLIPFWSYALFSRPEYRWQIYMNVFLLVPLGFLLPFSANRNGVQTVLICLFFSALIEAAQYYFRLGLCEFDDVLHNTLGGALGYAYWRAIIYVDRLHGKEIRQFFYSFWQRIRKL